MTQPTFSVVTPSYNQAEFIAATLDSVKNQSYEHVEHIVMDGGSDDGTLDILREYEDTYDLTWYSEDDDGQSDAINTGFDRATGEIVAWLNSDDVYFDVDVLARVVDYFERSEADIIYGDLAYIDHVGTVTSVDVRPEFDAAKLPYRILIGQPATFFRGHVVAEEQLRTDLDYSMDYEYWLRLAQRFTIEHVEDILAGFRMYEAQKSQDRKSMSAELREVFADYEYPTRSPIVTVADNVAIEARRLASSIRLAVRLSRQPPVLAYDGRIAPLHVLLKNLGPSPGDALKVLRRLMSGGKTG